MPNKVGDKMLPCGTPCSCLNMSDNVLPIRTLNVRSGGRYREQIDMDLDRVTFTATACKLLFISICL